MNQNKFAAFTLRLLVACATILFWSNVVTATTVDLYVTFPLRNLIERISPSGVRTTFASGLSLPYAIKFDASGNLFEADYSSNSIFKFTPSGTRTTFVSGLSGPVGLIFDSSGNLFESDGISGHIYKFTPAGTRSTFFSGLTAPAGIAFDAGGNLFVTTQGDFNSGSGTIERITPEGARTTIATGLYDPFDLAFDATGNLFATDQGSGNVFKFSSPSWTKTTFASLVSVSEPVGVAFDASGNLFASEYTYGNIDQFSPTGSKSVFVNGPPQGAAFLAFAPTPVPEPSAFILAANSGGLLWLGQRRLRRFGNAL